MRYVVAGLFVIALLASGSAMAREGRKVADVLKNPIEMNDGTSPRMAVTFNHSSHKVLTASSAITWRHRTAISLFPVPMRNVTRLLVRVNATP